MMKSYAVRQRYDNKIGISYPYQPEYVLKKSESCTL